MTSKMHWVGQALAMILQALNLYGGLVPVKYQPLVAFALAAVQAGIGLYNHYFTPQGTKIVVVLLFALLLPGIGKAQTTTSEPAVQHFVISESAAGYGDAKGSTAVNLAGVAVQITNNVSAGYFQITNPTDGTAPK